MSKSLTFSLAFNESISFGAFPETGEATVTMIFPSGCFGIAEITFHGAQMGKNASKTLNETPPASVAS